MRQILLRRYGDPLLATAVIALYLLELSRWEDGSRGWVVLAILVGGVGLGLRRQAPLVGFLLANGSIQAVTRLAPGFDNDSAGLVAMFFISLYSVGRHTTGLDRWLGAAGVLAVMTLFTLSESNGAIDSGDVGFVLVFAGAPWAVGLAIRLRRDRERALLAESEAAVARERARIARELHDVVAHAISVTVVQARGGRAMLGRDETAVRRALDAIEQTNTAALSDMRRLLAVLRDTDGPDTGRAAPQPSLANLDGLLEQVRAAGLPVEVVLSGTALAVPPGVDLSAYRIVQESLTNVIKHAGREARARVRIDYGTHALTVTVADDGTGTASWPEAGHGLVGIRERVAVVGGRVQAGPGPQGGFVVEAHLPYALESEQAVQPVLP